MNPSYLLCDVHSSCTYLLLFNYIIRINRQYLAVIFSIAIVQQKVLHSSPVFSLKLQQINLIGSKHNLENKVCIYRGLIMRHEKTYISINILD